MSRNARQIFDGLVDPVVGDIVAGRFGAERQVVTHVLLDEAVAVVTADHRVGEVHVFDLGLQFAPAFFGDLATEDNGDLVGLTDGAVGIEEPFSEFVEGGPPIKDQVVAVFDLREEQAVVATGVVAFSRCEKRGETDQPFVAAAGKVFGGEGVGQLLQTLGCAAP